MRYVRRVLLNGFAGITQGARRLGVYATATGLVLALYSPVSTRAEAVTQNECLQWLIQVTGESGQFPSTVTTADLIQWARVKGMNPTGGWQPDAVLTAETLAQVLVQMMGINPAKRGGDYIKILEREGIIIPAEGLIDRAALVSAFTDPGLQQRVAGVPPGPPFGLPPGPPPNTPPVSPHRKGNNGGGNGDGPPPPGWSAPRNPHSGNP